MSKSTDLLKNTGILAIGNFSSKILVFLLVPVYTAVLTTGEYGSYDIIYSTISLLIPLLTLNISDALLRFPLEDDANIPKIARYGIGITILSGVIVFIAQLFLEDYFSNIAGFQYLAPYYVSMALYQLLLLFARGTEHMVDVAVAGVISTIIVVLLNILFLLVFQWGLKGFFFANILCQFVPACYLIVRLRKDIFGHSTRKDHGLLKRMVVYSLPLSMTVIGWWFINSSGRFIVTSICGIDANGLYSIAFKIPSIITVISTIFLQAWQVSAIKEFDPKDKDGFLSNTFDTIEAMLVILCSILIVLTPFLAKVMYIDEFFEAWHFVPLLIVFAVQNTMSGMWGPFFSARYDTAPLAISAVLGALINVLLGIPLTMALGIWGMIVASLVAGFVNWLYRGKKVERHISIDFHLMRSFALEIFLVIQGLILVFLPVSFEIREISAIFLSILLILLFRKDIMRGATFLARSIRSRV